MDKTTICNLSLGRIGANLISDISEDKYLGIIYQQCLEEVLCENAWGFAEKRAELAEIDNTTLIHVDCLSHVYPLPADFLKLTFVNCRDLKYKIEGGNILTNRANLRIKYTSRVLGSEPSLYFPMFTSALSAKLSLELIYNKTNATPNQIKIANDFYNTQLIKAIAGDSSQGSFEEPRQDAWEAARLGGLPGDLGDWIPIAEIV